MKIIWGMLLASCLLINNSVHAQRNQGLENVIQQLVLEKSKTASLTLEASLIKEQNKIYKEYQSSLLDTVYWALSAIAGTIFVILSFNWWSNTKVYARDKAEFERSLTEKTLSVSSQASLEMAEIKAELVTVFQQQIQEIERRFSDEINRVQRERAEDSLNLHAKITAIQSWMSATDKQLGVVQKQIALGEVALRHVEERVWESKGSQLNVLLTVLQGAYAAHEAGSESLVKSNIERAIVIATDVIAKGGACLESMKERLDYYVSAMAREYPDLTSPLQNLIAKIPVKEG